MIYKETSPPENLRYHTNREKEDITPTRKREVNNSKNALLVGDMFKVIYLVTVIFYVFTINIHQTMIWGVYCFICFNHLKQL